MIRLHVICEGQTEQAFVNSILLPFLTTKSISMTSSKIGKPGHKGGRVNFDRLLSDLRSLLLSDTSRYCTTLIDYYGLPSDFPGLERSRAMNAISEKANCVKHGLSSQLETHIGQSAIRRFIPYVQMHEFEGLLFCDATSIASAIDRPILIRTLNRIRSDFETPEHINDSPQTAPSKRIESLFPGYEKVIHGSNAAKKIGLDNIREECRLFDAWVSELIALCPTS